MTGRADLTAYIDGASRNNPGPAAIGVVLLEGDRVVATVSRCIGRATNNVAEYSSLIAALSESREFGARSVNIYTDSELLARQWSGAYKVRNPGLKPLYAKAKSLGSQFESVSVSHIPRHQNREADRLCNLALDNDTE